MAAATTRTENKTEDPGGESGRRRPAKTMNATWGSRVNTGLSRSFLPQDRNVQRMPLKPLSWGSQEVRVKLSGEVDLKDLHRALEAGEKMLSENAHLAPEDGTPTVGYSMQAGNVTVEASVRSDQSGSQGSRVLSKLANLLKGEMDRKEAKEVPVAAEKPQKADEPRVEPPMSEPVEKPSGEDVAANRLARQASMRGMFASMRGVAD